MVWDAGTITDAAPWNQISQKMKNICGAAGAENWEFVKNVAAGTEAGQSGSASYSLDVFRCNGKNTKKKCPNIVLIGSTASTTDTNSYNITTSALKENRFYMVVVMSSKASSAEDPSSVSLNGSNPPTFTLIASQALTDASATQKLSIWLGKSGADIPSGTTLNIAFANNTTGIVATVYEITGISTSLAATGIDATGATQAVVQAVVNTGANSGTSEFTALTMPALLDLDNFWFGAIGGISTANGTFKFTTINPTSTFEQIATPNVRLANGWSPDGETVIGKAIISSTLTYWAAIGIEFVVDSETTSFTNLNLAGDDWYLVIERPVSDGAVQSAMTVFHRFNCEANLFSSPGTFSRTNVTPVGSKYWRTKEWYSYASVPSLNRMMIGNLLTTGFTYWLKVTPNIFIFNVLANSSRWNFWAMLFESLVTSYSDPVPLISFAVKEALGEGGSFCTLPGVTTSANNFTLRCEPWITPVALAHTQQLADYNDLWINAYRVFVSRVLILHNAGFYYGNTQNLGGVRGLMIDEILCMANPSSTAVVGDTMQIEGNEWAVVGSGYVGYNAGQRLNFMVRTN